MSQYRTGTVSVTFGQTAVTGVGTTWAANVTVGDMLLIGEGGPAAFVGAVVSDTALTLESAWPGASAAGVPYAIHRDFEPTTGAPLLSPGDMATVTAYNRAIQRLAIQTAGAVAGLEAVQEARAARDQAQDAQASAADSAAEAATDRGAVAADKVAVAADKLIVAADKSATQTALTQAQVARDAAAGSAGAAAADRIQTGADKAATGTALAAAQLLVGSAGTGTATGLAYAAATKSLASAADVIAVGFYDRRLDGDGGAWGDRPGRSWYWELLGTATRGVTRRFPVVVFWVLRASSFTIYDLHDLDADGVPRMWMVFNAGGTFTSWTNNTLNIISTGTAFRSVSAANGRFYIASGAGLFEINFSSDEALYRSDTQRKVYGRDIRARNSGNGYTQDVPNIDFIANYNCSHVDACVLPGGPLDSAGLPIPTVAVATAAGASVIHPWGAVYDLTATATRTVFVSPHRLWLLPNSAALRAGPIPYADASTAAWAVRTYGVENFPNLFPRGASLVCLAPGAVGTTGGLSWLAEDEANPDAGMVATTTISYATGWMPGDVRGAWLRDTATGNVTGSVLFNDDCSSATGWTQTSGWTLDAGNTEFDHSSGTTALTRAISGMTVGQFYVVRVTTGNRSAGTLTVSATGGVITGQTSITADGTALLTIEATATSGTLVFTPTNDFNGSVQSVRADIALPDRSYKSKGLVVNGTLGRTALPCGLAAVSGFSSTAYLWQPYNPDLEYGTGDWAYDFWLSNSTATPSFDRIFDRGLLGLASGAHIRALVSAGQLVLFASDGTNTATATTPALAWGTGIWRHVAFCRRSGTLEIWVDGVLAATQAAGSVGTLNCTGAELRIGAGLSGVAAWGGGVVMAGVSAYAPTPAQIRRMFEDERALIVGGTPATLGGTSNSVTALAANDGAGTLAVGTGDGVSIFAGLGRVQYLDGASGGAAIGSDTIVSVSASGPHLLIGTAAGAGLISDGVIARDRMVPAGRPRVSPVDGPGVVTMRGVTTDATPTDLTPRIAIGEREAVTLDVTVQARTYGAASTQGGVYRRLARYIRDDGGNVTLTGSVQTIGTDQETTAGMDVTLSIDTGAQTITPRVTGVAATRIVWTARITITRISEGNSYAA
ncbi:LamG-like jellyroll fold domain-containing protein [Niveispirillum sp.]|uniref:LamG-like jellyroll fold domain-containing protein n=1 Tax=Niveispirillum sp. TaxID=1917217 RepID=UPI001B42B3D4|nr:LamG-like jellyroll fold domain-containing protein [Niveispirillum sp.]MBP7339645.1 hypothetical protein [Niveispirillum sp.]